MCYIIQVSFSSLQLAVMKDNPDGPKPISRACEQRCLGISVGITRVFTIFCVAPLVSV